MVISPARSDVHAALAAAEHMRQRIQQFPIESRRAWELGQTWQIPQSIRAPRQIVVVGMGGSAVGGDFLRATTRHAITIQSARDYSPPVCDADTLVIASSFSGNTEETLAAIESPEAASAMKLVLTTGGRIREVADTIGAALLAYECDGPPRTAWEYGFLPILALLSRLGVTPEFEQQAPLALDRLAQQASAVEAAAAALAPGFTARIPFVVGGEHLAPVARRWACQLNENSKRVAFFGEIPELNHNFLLGLTDARADAIAVILLDSDLLSQRGRARLDLTELLLRSRGVSYERVLIAGTTELDAMLQGALLGDWLSWHLAVAGGVDPSDTSALETFKTTLSATPTRHP